MTFDVEDGWQEIAPLEVNDVIGNVRVALEYDSCVYDGKDKRPKLTVSHTNWTDGIRANEAVRANSGTVIPEGEYSVTYEDNVNAGTATVVIADIPGGNYVVDGKATFTIEKRPLTATAVDQTVYPGGSIKIDPKFVKCSGLAEGHTVKAVRLKSGSTKIAGSRGSILPTYVFIADAQGNGVTDNYNITYKYGVLTVRSVSEPAPVVPDYTLLAQLKIRAHTALRVTWTKVEGADGYDVYFAKNDSCFTQPVSVTKGLTCKFTGLDKKTVYKAYVQAWKKDGSKKTVIGKPSPTVCAVTGNADKKRTNAAKVTVKKARLTLKVGKSETIKATVKGAKSGKQVLKQDKKLLRYYSSDRNVATVNKSGKVKAVASGSCTIWVIAANGLRTAVKVKVK